MSSSPTLLERAAQRDLARLGETGLSSAALKATLPAAEELHRTPAPVRLSRACAECGAPVSDASLSHRCPECGEPMPGSPMRGGAA